MQNNMNNNITDINEYQNNIMPDTTGANIYNAASNMSMSTSDIAANDNVEEFVSEEFVNSYLQATNQNTPDLWSRIEAGFQEEVWDMVAEKRRRNARVLKTVGYVAAAALITLVAIPAMLLSMGGSNTKDEMMYTESTTTADIYHEEAADTVEMEAPADSVDSVMEDEVYESITEAASESGDEADGSSQGTNNSISSDASASENQTQAQLREIEGIQTDERQIVVVCEITFDDATDAVTIEIKEVKGNQYDELPLSAGYKITLTNPMFVQVMDVMLYEEEIVLDSVEMDEAGNIIGRIIKIKHQQ